MKNDSSRLDQILFQFTLCIVSLLGLGLWAFVLPVALALVILQRFYDATPKIRTVLRQSFPSTNLLLSRLTACNSEDYADTLRHLYVPDKYANEYGFRRSNGANFDKIRIDFSRRHRRQLLKAFRRPRTSPDALVTMAKNFHYPIRKNTTYLTPPRDNLTMNSALPETQFQLPKLTSSTNSEHCCHCSKHQCSTLKPSDSTRCDSIDSMPATLDRPLSAPALPNFRLPFVVMPRPGQPGALEFNGKDVSRFLRRWELDCDDFEISPARRCERLPFYCTDEIEKTVRCLPGYPEQNWDQLKASLKSVYSQYEEPEDSMIALQKLVVSAQLGQIDLDVFILRYDALSGKLVDNGSLSRLDRIYRLIDGLDDDMKAQVFDFMAEKRWRFSIHDGNGMAPDFSKLKDFVTELAMTSRLELIYQREREMRMNGHLNTQGTPTSSTTAPITPTMTIPTTMTPTVASPTITSPTITSPAIMTPMKAIPSTSIPIIATVSTPTISTPFDSTDAFATKFSEVTAPLIAKLDQIKPTKPSMTSTSNSLAHSRSKSSRCIWCDSAEHTTNDCIELRKATNEKLVKRNGFGRLMDEITGKELRPMFGKGGMKTLIARDSRVPTASINAISQTS
jgi:hypothetical protein